MKKASDFFSDEEQRQIADAVASAETMTAGEIVPVVATASGRYDRAEDIVGLATAMLLLSVYWTYFQAPANSAWTVGNTVAAPLWPVLLIILGGFVAGAVLATVFPALRLPFISRQEMQQEVERRARETFQSQRVRATEASTGVLIYVSLYEHMVHVVGDDAVNAAVGAEQWQATVDMIVAGMKQKRPAEGLVKAIRHCGELLREPFPIREGDRNELANRLVLLD